MKHARNSGANPQRHPDYEENSFSLGLLMRLQALVVSCNPLQSVAIKRRFELRSEA
jgi:hypothetical protein